jgi:hypothetical protein
MVPSIPANRGLGIPGSQSCPCPWQVRCHHTIHVWHTAGGPAGAALFILTMQGLLEELQKLALLARPVACAYKTSLQGYVAGVTAAFPILCDLATPLGLEVVLSKCAALSVDAAAREAVELGIRHAPAGSVAAGSLVRIPQLAREHAQQCAEEAQSLVDTLESSSFLLRNTGSSCMDPCRSEWHTCPRLPSGTQSAIGVGYQRLCGGQRLQTDWTCSAGQGCSRADATPLAAWWPWPAPQQPAQRPCSLCVRSCADRVVHGL